MKKVNIYNNNKLVTSSESNSNIVHYLQPNFWYDNFSVTYEENGYESTHTPIPSFKTNHREEVILDIARRYISKDGIMKVIDTISDNGGHHLQLYLSDNDRFSIYSEYLGQTSTEKNDEYLTKQEVLDIVKYANDKDIIITPNVDVPGHSGKWLSIVKEKYPDKTIQSDFDDTLVDYWYNEDAYEAVETLLKEVMDLFKQDLPKQQRFNIGADESAGSESNQPAYVDFINHISEFVTSNGYQTLIWNDSIYQNGLDRLNKDIEIYYWKKPGTGLTPSDLADSNRDVTNCNFYSTTFMPASKFEPSDIEWQQNYIKDKFNTDTFCEGYDDNQTFVPINKPLSVRGTAMVFWSENSLDLTEEQYLNQVLPLIETYLSVAV